MYKLDENGEIQATFFRTPYNYDTNAASKRSGLNCTDATRAQQQFKEECDINTIVERFGLTGQLPQNVQMPITQEFVDVMDYQSALNKLMEADAAFMELPAKIRAEFQNDAGKFVEFATDPKNLEQCRAWGLAKPIPGPIEPIEVRVRPEPAPTQSATAE